MKRIVYLVLVMSVIFTGLALAQVADPAATAAPAATPAPPDPLLPTTGTWGWVVTILLGFNVLLSALVKIIESIAVKTASTADDKAASFVGKLMGWLAWLLRIIGAAPSTPTVLRKQIVRVSGQDS